MVIIFISIFVFILTINSLFTFATYVAIIQAPLSLCLKALHDTCRACWVGTSVMVVSVYKQTSP